MKRSEMIVLPNGKRIRAHGTPSAYNAGCRCEDCTTVNRNRMAGQRERWATDSPLTGPDDPRHGTPTAYSSYGCRCEPCTKANRDACAEYKRSTREARSERAKSIDPDDPRHGTLSFYVYWLCRCDKCRAANAARAKLRTSKG